MESQEMPCCAARERSDRRSAKLQPLGFFSLTCKKNNSFCKNTQLCWVRFLPGVTKSAPRPPRDSLSCEGEALLWRAALRAGELSRS